MDTSDGVLQSTKKPLGIAPDYSAFDDDILLHINGAIGVLEQVGVPLSASEVDQATTWVALLGSGTTKAASGMVKQYIFLYVKSIFDPPQNSFAVNAMEEQLQMLTVRINTAFDFPLEETP